MAWAQKGKHREFFKLHIIGIMIFHMLDDLFDQLSAANLSWISRDVIPFQRPENQNQQFNNICPEYFNITVLPGLKFAEHFTEQFLDRPIIRIQQQDIPG